MIPKDFTTFLASPENNDFSVEQIEKLLQQYPYVQSLRIALLRKLKATNHPNYQKHLHTTSAYAYDRVFLRKYINKENIYVVEYPAMKVEVEQLETLDLVPLGELKQEVDAPFLDLENTNSAANEITFPSDDWESIFNQNENITAETVENSEEIDQQSPITNQEMKDQKEIQALILESQRVEKHAPIEEDIDNLLGDDELEGLDDEVEFEFEIDKQIIGDEEDLSMFDDHGVNHHDDHHDEHDDKHFAEDNYEVSEHENRHGEADNSHEVKKPLHEIIHEKISDLITENPAIKEAKYEETVSENKDEEVVLKTEENFELSLDNVFRKDDRPAYIDVDDESELPLEEEQETIISTANVNEIRAALSDKYQNKEAKKERIKKYLQRIAQIPAEENGIITETYADLLAKQGKIERSIKMYQQLILKNPQKKVYFAAKIKQLIKNI